jgi:hypothetical protein
MSWSFLLITSHGCHACKAFKEHSYFAESKMMEDITGEGSVLYHFELRTNNLRDFERATITKYYRENKNLKVAGLDEGTDERKKIIGRQVEFKSIIGWYPYFVAFTQSEFESFIDHRSKSMPTGYILRSSGGQSFIAKATSRDEKVIDIIKHDGKTIAGNFVHTILHDLSHHDKKELGVVSVDDIEVKESLKAGVEAKEQMSPRTFVNNKVEEKEEPQQKPVRKLAYVSNNSKVQLKHGDVIPSCAGAFYKSK